LYIWFFNNKIYFDRPDQLTSGRAWMHKKRVKGRSFSLCTVVIHKVIIIIIILKTEINEIYRSTKVVRKVKNVLPYKDIYWQWERNRICRFYHTPSPTSPHSHLGQWGTCRTVTNSRNNCCRLHIYWRTNKTLIQNSLYVFDKWGKILLIKRCSTIAGRNCLLEGPRRSG
jgi:hypothetical protein